MADKQSSDPAAGVRDRNREAMNRNRDVAKWLVVVFGAIGGVLLTGTQLSDIGADGTNQCLAIAGIVAGMVGAGIVLAFTVRVLLPITLSLEDLATGKSGSKTTDFVKKKLKDRVGWAPTPAIDKLVAKDPTLVGDSGTEIKDLYGVWKEKWDTQRAVRARYEAEGPSFSLERELKASEKEVERVDAAGATFLSFALTATVRQRMQGAVAAIFFGGVLVAAGITMFSFATNHDDASASGSPAEAVPKQPSWVNVKLTPYGAKVLTKRVGDNCPMNPLGAIALGGAPDALDLVSVPSADCETTRFTLTPNIGVVRNERRVIALP